MHQFKFTLLVLATAWKMISTTKENSSSSTVYQGCDKEAWKWCEQSRCELGCKCRLEIFIKYCDFIKFEIFIIYSRLCTRPSWISRSWLRYILLLSGKYQGTEISENSTYPKFFCEVFQIKFSIRSYRSRFHLIKKWEPVP